MTDPLGPQSGATGTGQSADPGNQGTGNAPNADGQSAVTPPVVAPPEAGPSAVTREEFDRLRAHLAAADIKRTEAENRLKQIQDKDMPEMQKLTRDLAEAQAQSAAALEANSALRVENAFHSDNTYDWHDSRVALKQLDRSKITVDADGNVTGMKDALKALATAAPFLLKPKAAEGGQAGPQTPASPGVPPTNGGIAPQAGAAPDKAAMARRFPAMRQKL